MTLANSTSTQKFAIHCGYITPTGGQCTQLHRVLLFTFAIAATATIPLLLPLFTFGAW